MSYNAGSVSSTSAGSATLREASETIAGETGAEQLPSTTGETVTGQLSPSSPTEDSSGELRTDRPRLQRSMGQSKKTFRLRKSRKSHIETTQTKLEQSDAASVEQPMSQPKATGQMSSTMDPSSSNIPSNSSSIRSRRSLSLRKSDGDKNSNVPADQQQFHGAAHQYHHCHHFHHHAHPQVSDVSWDEDTSSTSGYRESYSMQIVSLDGTNARSGQAPPLASPDLNDMPSTSSTTTNYIAFDGSSPDCSMNGSGGEKTALLENERSSQRTTSQHSLLMVFPNQDEDTLI